MKGILIFAVGAAFVAIVTIALIRSQGAAVILGAAVALVLGAALGSRWTRASRSYRDWRTSVSALRRLRRDVVAKGRSLGAALVGVGLAVAVIVVIMRGK